MEQNKQPVKQFYYSEKEWSRLGCGPLPAERDTKFYGVIDDNVPVDNSKIDKNQN